MTDQKIFVKLLQKYSFDNVFNRFFDFINRDEKRFQNTFTKAGNFVVTGTYAGAINHKSGKYYVDYLRRTSIDRIKEELGI